MCLVSNINKKTKTRLKPDKTEHEIGKAWKIEAEGNHATQGNDQAAIEKLVADRVAKVVATDRAARGDASGAGGPAGALAARQCSFASYMKCNPTSFHRNERDVELWPGLVLVEFSEKKKVEAYIRRLSHNIKGETTSSKPANLNEAVRMAHTLMEQKIQARAERVAEGNKKR
ncbi:hypothetical protein Tco_0858531 [Tanacetum coccineum]|uniref:Uncharacterized protein n=1 Tax=Tanacetum coccineum TaxID=301880 RepID=A0ABQ5BDF6_9ASTR